MKTNTILKSFTTNTPLSYNISPSLKYVLKNLMHGSIIKVIADTTQRRKRASYVV